MKQEQFANKRVIESEQKTWFPVLGNVFLFCFIVAIPLIYEGTTDVHRARIILVSCPFLIFGIIHLLRTGLGFAFPKVCQLGLSLLGVGLLVSGALASHEVAAWIRISEIAWGLSVIIVVARWCMTFPVGIVAVLVAIPVSYSVSNYRFLLEWLSFENPQAIDWTFSVPGYFQYRNLGFAAAPALLVCSWLPFSDVFENLDTKLRRIFIGLTIIVGTVGWGIMAWSGTRAGFLSVFVGLAFVGLCTWRMYPTFKFILLSVGTMLVGSFASIPFTPETGSFGFLRILTGVVKTSGTGPIVDEYSSGRVEIWLDAIRRLKNDWLFGFGPDQYQFQEALPSRILEPHNVAINLLVESGMIGLVGFFVLIFLLLRSLFNSRKNKYSGILIGLVALYSFYSLVDGTFVWSLPFAFQMVLLGCCVAVTAKPIQGAKTRLSVVFAALFTLIGAALSCVVLYQAESFTKQPPLPESREAKFLYRFPATTWGITSWLAEWEKSQYDGLDDWYQMLISESPAPSFYRIEYAYYLVRRGDLPGAIENLEKAFEEAPKTSLGRLHSAHDANISQLRAMLASSQKPTDD